MCRVGLVWGRVLRVWIVCVDDPACVCRGVGGKDDIASHGILQLDSSGTKRRAGYATSEKRQTGKLWQYAQGWAKVGEPNICLDILARCQLCLWETPELLHT